MASLNPFVNGVINFLYVLDLGLMSKMGIKTRNINNKKKLIKE